MKYFSFSLVAAVCAILTFASCSSSSNVAGPSEFGERVDATECQKMAEEKPAIRNFGMGQSAKMYSARQLAEMDARASMSSRLDGAIRAAAKRAGFDISQYAGDDKKGGNAYDNGGTQNTFMEAVTSNILANTVTLKTETFLAKNKQYTVFVCIEYSGSAEDMAKAVFQAVKQNVSDTDRAKIDNENDKFIKEIEEFLNKQQN